MHPKIPTLALAQKSSDEPKPPSAAKRILRIATRACALVLALLFIAGCDWWKKEPIVEDEAKLAGKKPSDFPQITADVFQADGRRNRAYG